ncbi:serine protease [Rhizocola hellebori]|uniref:Serine protease n=1 Tax=Rhizocola hellebori TaxID=1392758 RepID=A0A8J3VLT6_9ACTN|nr:S8 family peptidase [Rhizocola hellebori]GIH11022.1 serine protease [Rhizocola hellebori]
MKLLLASLLALGSPVAAAAPEGAILPAANAVAGSYVVVLRDGVSPASVTARHAGTVGRVFTSALNGFEVSLSEKEARRLAADPSVAYVQQNGTVHVDPGVLGTQPNPPSWGLDRIDQRNLPLDNSYTYPNTAGNVHAYILSTGIRTTHVDFGGRAIHGRDVVDNDDDATDCNGHGTSVAGVVGGSTYGVAKNVTLVAVRMLDCAGTATIAQVIAGVDWVTANAVKPAIGVLVAGGPTDLAYNSAIRRSIASGVTYTAVSGSSASDACQFSPGGVTEAITVAATDMADNKHSASNFGPCLDIFAPGVLVNTLWYTSDTATITLSGSSYSTAYAAGVAALIASANPAWTPQQVRDEMVADATPGVVINPGTGSPNLLAYVDNAGAPPPCTGTNPNDVTIPDSPAAAVNSRIVIAGCTGNASSSSAVEVHIIHPFRGDLQVDLLAPDGTAYRLQSRSADSGDDIHTTYVVDLSREVRNGNWRLRVRDRRALNTGFIDSWTLRL